MARTEKAREEKKITIKVSEQLPRKERLSCLRLFGMETTWWKRYESQNQEWNQHSQ